MAEIIKIYMSDENTGDLDYIPDYKEYEKERQANEKKREDYYNEIQNKVNNGEFNGKSLEYNWDGTKLGVRLEGDPEYDYSDFQEVINEAEKTLEEVLVNKTQEVIDETNLAKEEALTQANHAQTQGDYAKEQAENIISANAEATKIIDNFESNVKEYTSTFNSNVEEKTTVFNNNATEKQNTFDTNAAEKIETYNLNAEAKTKEFNSNTKEMERLIDSVVPKNYTEGKELYITDALPYKVFNYSADGNFYQKTTTGQQLYNVNNVNELTPLYTIDEDDFVTLSCDNTNGTQEMYRNFWVNKSDILKENTNYKLVLEIKEFSQLDNTKTSYFHILGEEKECQFTKGISTMLNKAKIGTFVYDTSTKESFEETTLMARNFLAIPVGDNVSVTFRVSVIEDTSVTADTFIYEPFTNGASPNPNYPQKIEVIKDNFDIKITRKNLLKIDTFADGTTEKSNNGVNFVINKDGTITVKGTATSDMVIGLKKNDFQVVGNAYFLCNSLNANARVEFACNIDGVDRYINDYGTGNFINITNKFTFKDIYLVIKTGTTIDTTFKVMFALGTVATDFEPYQEQIVPIDLKGNEVCAIGDVKDTLEIKDGRVVLNKRIGKLVLNGSEEWFIDNWFTSTDNSTHFKYGFTDYADDEKTVISTHFRYVDGQEQNNGYVFTNLPAKFITLSTNTISTVEEFKQWLSENNVTVYYILATPEVIDLGELTEVIKTFEGINYINLLANLEPTNASIEYALDIKKYVDNMQNI